MNLPESSSRKKWSIELRSTHFVLAVSAIFLAFYNTRFFASLIAATHFPTGKEILFVANVTLLVFALTFLVISLFTLPRIGKPLLMLIFWIAAGAAYFMQTYGIVIHTLMIQNVVETDISEVRDLLSPSLLGYLLVLGLLPSLILSRIHIRFGSLKTETITKAKSIAAALLAVVALLGSMHSDYIALFRNHKNVRQMVNPLNFIYAGISYASSRDVTGAIKPIETDARIDTVGQLQSKPTLLILVIGETARADHFGINGYARDTTPNLARQDIVNFTQVTSCGTETAVSVPCMFSNLGRSHYSDSKAKSQEGLLDVVKHAGINLLWRDNNSGCKGACDRVTHENVQHLQVPVLCNARECFDEVLLQDMDAKLSASPGSLLLVLHQKGSHGPDYYHRYPQSMEHFKPVCQSNELQQCAQSDVINAYDNSIRYTDYFLSQAIDWLKSKQDRYDTSLVYISDHGESLGENGMYLHGMPYMIAPETQKHVPMIFWLSDNFKQDNAIDSDCMKNLSANPYSHDNLFHTVLGMLNISSAVYDQKRDIIHPCRSRKLVNRSLTTPE